MEEQIRIRRNITLVNFAISFTKRIQKFSDSKEFTDGVNIIWENWSNKIRIKLRINTDYWEIENIKIGYILFRIDDFVIKHIYSRSGSRIKKFFQICDEIFETLTEFYKDPDQKKHNFRKYHVIIQDTRKFIDFYAEFKRFFFEMNITEKILMKDLEEKIAFRLRALWYTRDLTTLKQTKKFIIKLNNQQRNERVIKKKTA